MSGDNSGGRVVVEVRTARAVAVPADAVSARLQRMVRTSPDRGGTLSSHRRTPQGWLTHEFRLTPVMAAPDVGQPKVAACRIDVTTRLEMTPAAVAQTPLAQVRQELEDASHLSIDGLLHRLCREPGATHPGLD